MPTAQARLTRTRGLHATRSSIRSDNDMSSLSERRVARRFFVSRWHRAHTCHPPKFRDSDLRRTIAAWLPGASDLRALSWAHVRVRGAAGRGCHIPAWLGIARFARSSYVSRALFGISTSAVSCGRLAGGACLACLIIGAYARLERYTSAFSCRVLHSAPVSGFFSHITDFCQWAWSRSSLATSHGDFPACLRGSPDSYALFKQ